MYCRFTLRARPYSPLSTAHKRSWTGSADIWVNPGSINLCSPMMWQELTFISIQCLSSFLFNCKLLEFGERRYLYLWLSPWSYESHGKTHHRHVAADPLRCALQPNPQTHPQTPQCKDISPLALSPHLPLCHLLCHSFLPMFGCSYLLPSSVIFVTIFRHAFSFSSLASSPSRSPFNVF